MPSPDRAQRSSRRRAVRLLPPRIFRQQPADRASTTNRARLRRSRASSSRSAIGCRWNRRYSARRRTPCASSGNRRPAAAGMRRSSSSLFRIDIPELIGSTLYFWLYSPEPIAAADLPGIVLSDALNGLQVATLPGSFTADVPLASYTGGDLPAGRWVQVRIPMKELRSASVYPFHPERLQSVIFHQRRADGAKHVLIVDDVRIDDEPAAGVAAAALPVPDSVSAKGYDRHIDVQWRAPAASSADYYVVYRSIDSQPFVPVGTQRPGVNRLADFIGRSGVTARYRVAAADWQGRESAQSAVVTAATREMSDDELLTMLQEAAFRYYWEASGVHSGMAHENIPGDDRIVATGATGLGISALVAAVDRKFITRDQGLERLETIVSFLERAPRYHGAWSHYYNDATGETMSLFGMYDNGGDIIETSYMIQGLLTARGYFNRKSAREQALGKRITALWHAVEWDWYRDSPDQPVSLLALVAAMGISDPSPADRIQRDARDLSARDRIAHASGAREHVLQRLGQPGAARAELSGRLVREPGRQALCERPDLLRHQARRRCQHRRTAVLHALHVHGVRSARLAGSIHGLVLREQPPHRADQSRLLHRESQEVRGLRAECLGIDGELRFQRLLDAGAGSVERRRHDHAHRRAGVVSLYARSVDGRVQAFLPRARRRALGHLRSSRQLQPESELARLSLHGPQPGADRRHDRESSHRPVVALVHVESRNRRDAEEARRRKNRDAP